MPKMLDTKTLRDGPNGAPTQEVASIGDQVTIKSSKDNWVEIALDNPPRTGWVPAELVDAAAPNVPLAGGAPPLTRPRFVEKCVLRGIESGVNPHYLFGIAQLRSGVQDTDNGAEKGPYRFTAADWATLAPDFGPGDISAWDIQIPGFALMVQRTMAQLGGTPTPEQLYLAQWPQTDPATIAAKLKAAFDQTADEEAESEKKIIGVPAEPAADPPPEGQQFGGTASGLPISDKAYSLIIEFEVSSESVYTRKYSHTEWPGGRSGVTIGIGYDVGYATAAQLNQDWNGKLPAAMIALLGQAIGVRGQPAKALSQTLHPNVTVPWADAIAVHKGVVMPRWIGLVERALPNCNMLSPDRLGALVSLAYNRGPSFSAQGPRYLEMREIRQAMVAQNFNAIPQQIRAMKRLWPDVPGLQTRREREAVLFERG